MAKLCHHCAVQMISVYDRTIDITIAWQCDLCGHEVRRDAAELAALVERRAREPAPAFPKLDPIRGGYLQ